MSNAAHTTVSLKALFASHGIPVRVRDNGHKFLVMAKDFHGVKAEGFSHYVVALIANAEGFTDVCGDAIGWSAFNGYREITLYKPGAVVRLGRAS
jgi:hypothetical protein